MKAKPQETELERCQNELMDQPKSLNINVIIPPAYAQHSANNYSRGADLIRQLTFSGEGSAVNRRAYLGRVLSRSARGHLASRSG